MGGWLTSGRRGSPVSDVAADRAVVDRIVDGVTAVLLVGPDETEMRVDVADLPDGTAEGTWLIVGGDPVGVQGVDAEMSADRQVELGQRIQRLRDQRRGGRFGR